MSQHGLLLRHPRQKQLLLPDLQIELRLLVWTSSSEWGEASQIWAQTPFTLLDMSSLEDFTAKAAKSVLRMERGLPANQVLHHPPCILHGSCLFTPGVSRWDCSGLLMLGSTGASETSNESGTLMSCTSCITHDLLLWGRWYQLTTLQDSTACSIRKCSPARILGDS